MVRRKSRRRNLKKLVKLTEYFLFLKREHGMTTVKISRIWKAWPVSSIVIVYFHSYGG